MDRGYVLHTYPYRETSLILQAWTEKHGRLGLVAKGARRPKSPQRAVLVPFQPLALDWFGRGELRTLKTAEPMVPAIPLRGQYLLSAFYLNELLLKLTTRDDPHERLFEAYDRAIGDLRAAAPLEPVLRRFELTLLQELGYAVELAREAGTHAPIAAEREYLYVVERGPVPAREGEERADAIRLRGLTLLDLERGRYEDPTTVAQAKSLMRLLINHSLNGQELATRSIVRDLQRLDDK
ncbi:MAG TPA: DNA repair protein RecO [Usitatibacter sp.]|nr:DNA repair protein RecO [Usitatibacter sp.]